MVNTRSKLKKTQNAIKTMGDYDNESGAFVVSNVDLLTEILIRLPATSILRFKSVSKHWRWLLSHRNFTMRFDRLSKSPGLFYGRTYVPFDVENVGTLPFRRFDCYPDPCGIKIVQSCNGLLLCRSMEWPFDKYYVINPTTKQFVVIPVIPGGHKKIRFMCLAFHQTDCVHFKLVCIRRLVPKEDELFQILVYSSETQKWKISIESFYSKGNFLSSGVYWKGAIFWRPFDHNPFYFKLDVEQLQSLPLPLPLEMMSSGLLRTYFGESRGHLHSIVTDYNGNDSLRFNVYEMLSDHSGWFVKYQVDLDQLPIIYEHGYEFSVIDVIRGAKEEDTFMVLSIPKKLITYNVHDKSFKQIFSLNYFYLRGGYPCSLFYRYIETISSF